MHESVLRWLPGALTPAEVAGRRVLEVGAYDVNGSVRPAVEALGPGSYLGVDCSPGPRVDQVLNVADLTTVFGRDAFDVVISTEMLEHVVDWQDAIARMCDVLRPGGVLLLTTRSPGFPYHPFPIDTWRYTTDVMGEILAAAALTVQVLVDDPDPRAPGVFTKAVKPATWQPPWQAAPIGDVFAGIAVQEAPCA